MRTLLLSCILMAALQASTMNETLGYAPDYTQAVASASEQQRPVMVLVVSKACPWCREMENTTLSDPEVSAFVREKLSAYIMDKASGDAFLKTHPAPQVPMLYFIDPRSGELIFENLGYINKETLLEMAGEIVADFHDGEEE